jgi:hypothetical protein
VQTTTRGFGLLDLIVVLGLVAVLVWAVRLDWAPPPQAPAAAPAANS